MFPNLSEEELEKATAGLTEYKTESEKREQKIQEGAKKIQRDIKDALARADAEEELKEMSDDDIDLALGLFNETSEERARQYRITQEKIEKKSKKSRGSKTGAVNAYDDTVFFPKQRSA